MQEDFNFSLNLLIVANVVVGLMVICIFIALADDRKAVAEQEKLGEESIDKRETKIPKTIAGIFSGIFVMLLATSIFYGVSTAEDREQFSLQMKIEKILEQDKNGHIGVLYPISRDAAIKLASGKTVTVSVADPEGEVHEVPAKYGSRFSLYAQGLEAEKAVDGVVQNGERLRTHRSDQSRAVFVKKMRDTYGVNVRDILDKLELPESEPTELTTFGSAKLTQKLAENEYLQSNATLIWDGEFKLISDLEGSASSELQRLR